MQKKGGSQAVGRSRNYAFGKPGSMEPDFELNLGPPGFWRDSQTFLDGLAFCVSIAASPSIISVPKKHKTRI